MFFFSPSKATQLHCFSRCKPSEMGHNARSQMTTGWKLTVVCVSTHDGKVFDSWTSSCQVLPIATNPRVLWVHVPSRNARTCEVRRGALLLQTSPHVITKQVVWIMEITLCWFDTKIPASVETAEASYTSLRAVSPCVPKQYKRVDMGRKQYCEFFLWCRWKLASFLVCRTEEKTRKWSLFEVVALWMKIGSGYVSRPANSSWSSTAREAVHIPRRFMLETMSCTDLMKFTSKGQFTRLGPCGFSFMSHKRGQSTQHVTLVDIMTCRKKFCD